MKLKALSLQNLEQVRLWRNESLSGLRTSFLLTAEMQAKFYTDIICNRQANARFWGVCDEFEHEREVFRGGRNQIVKFVDLSFIGMTGLENISWENRLAEISLLLDPDYPMDKYGAEALHLLLKQGFMHMNLENICVEIYDCNPDQKFWLKIALEYDCIISVLPCRKFYNNKYWPSKYINFNKEAYLEHENSSSGSAQTPG